MIEVLFYILLSFVPIVLYPYTAELFEFNKMLATYALMVLIMVAWGAKMVAGKKFIFRRTILDIPLIVFLVSQIFSTITSIDFRTSLLGYYSRFNGGLLSSISYALLYWAFVSNMDAKKTKKALYFLLGSGVLVCLYGVLEHFGIDKNLWVQDVQNRVFSTLGQPNWLAAWVTALIPIGWKFAFDIEKPLKNKIYWLWIAVSTLFFLILIFTKSRSGLFGFAFMEIAFWGYLIASHFKKKAAFRKILIHLAISQGALVILALAFGTQLTPSLPDFIKNKTLIINVPTTTSSSGPALEVGGTDSGTIRRIVWKGAIEIWKHYPILGTGVETFAYSYYNFRPVEHNLVSEWDFLYNKAHNEYLNFMANTGTVGIVSYLILIVSTLVLFYKKRQSAFAAGYISILVSNFFGFSVVPVNLQFFLFPAIAIALANNQLMTNDFQLKKLSSGQKAAIVILLLVGSWLLIVIGRYWYADLLYAKGKLYDDSSQFAKGAQYLIQAERLSPNEAIFHNEISSSYSSIAVTLAQDHQKDKAQQFADAATIESDGAVKLSPANVNLRRSRVSMFIKLAIINPSYLNDALAVLLDAIKLAPTDAKLYYNLGLIYSRLGQNDEALQTLQHTVDIKANYKEARLALAILLNDRGDKKEARAQLEYILKYIDPNDSITKQQLEEVGK
ncbi:O-antigen ligase family protein [Patescibacteria group bacterium]|nr:O-antigen ligase family protein [Patescibacteria group bacterium]